MKIYIHAQQYWNTDFGIWPERKQQSEVLKEFDRDLEVVVSKTSFRNNFPVPESAITNTLCAMFI